MKKDKKSGYEVSKNGLVSLVLMVFLLVVLVVGVTYQVYLYVGSGSSVINKILGDDGVSIFEDGTVTLVYTEGESNVKIENAIPISDAEGKKLSNPDQLMDFTVNVSISKASVVNFQVVAEKDSISTIDDKYIKLYLERGINTPIYSEEIMQPTVYTGISEDNDYGVKKGNMVLDQVSTSESIIYYYRLRMWLSSDYELDNVYRTFKIKVNIYGLGERIKDESSDTLDKNTTDNNTTDNNATDNNTTDNNTTDNNATDNNTTTNTDSITNSTTGTNTTNSKTGV